MTSAINEKLILAAWNGNLKKVKLYIKEGADVNFKNKKFGQTALHLAAVNGHDSVATYLQSNGAEISSRNLWGGTPLHSAAESGAVSVVQKLLDNVGHLIDSDNQQDDPGNQLVNIQNALGNTPLHEAAKKDHEHVFSCLQSKGASLEIRNKEGLTAIDVAEKENSEKILNLFKRSGLPIEIQYLTSQDEKTFSSTLKSGSYFSYVGNIMCVGHEAVGKTAITSVLINKELSTERQSTEGIELHTYRAAVNMSTKKWIPRELKLKDVAIRDLVYKSKKFSLTLDASIENESEDLSWVDTNVLENISLYKDIADYGTNRKKKSKQKKNDNPLSDSKYDRSRSSQKDDKNYTNDTEFEGAVVVHCTSLKMDDKDALARSSEPEQEVTSINRKEDQTEHKDGLTDGEDVDKNTLTLRISADEIPSSRPDHTSISNQGINKEKETSNCEQFETISPKALVKDIFQTDTRTYNQDGFETTRSTNEGRNSKYSEHDKYVKTSKTSKENITFEDSERESSLSNIQANDQRENIDYSTIAEEIDNSNTVLTDSTHDPLVKNICNSKSVKSNRGRDAIAKNEHKWSGKKTDEHVSDLKASSVRCLVEEEQRKTGTNMPNEDLDDRRNLVNTFKIKDETQKSFSDGIQLENDQTKISDFSRFTLDGDEDASIFQTSAEYVHVLNRNQNVTNQRTADVIDRCEFYKNKDGSRSSTVTLDTEKNQRDKRCLPKMPKLPSHLFKVKPLRIDELQRQILRKGKDGLLDIALAPINMMDFGGQAAFYSTHQSFLTYRGIYILVVNGSKGFEEQIDTEPIIPGQNDPPTSKAFTYFWVSSIQSYSKGASDGYPKILIVCTHKDKVPAGQADQRTKEIFSEIEKMFKNTTAMNHLVLEPRIFLNAMNPEDPGYEQLRAVIVNLLCNQPSWGEKLPKAWISLKMEIDRRAEKGKTIMKMKDMKKINKENPIQELPKEELEVFLKMHHSQGDIIFFPTRGLKDRIVISPKFLVDTLRSLITHKTFCDGSRLETIESMNENGVLKKADIDSIWKGNPNFLKHKSFLLSLMEHLDILAVPKKYKKSGDLMKTDIYYVPSLIKIHDDTDFLKGNMASRAMGLSFKFCNDVLPPAIGYRFIASCLGMYEIKDYKGKKMLFCGMVVVIVKKGLDLVVKIRQDRVDIYLVHKTARVHIFEDTAAGTYECLHNVLVSIIESYQVMSVEGKMENKVPFLIEFPCFEISSPCYDQDKKNWKCPQHNYNITSGLKKKWFTKSNQANENCAPDCQGFTELDQQAEPSEVHLAKLSSQLERGELFSLALELGVEQHEREAIEYDNRSLPNIKFLCLLKWKTKTNGSFGDIIRAMERSEIPVHKACQMTKHRPMYIQDEILEEQKVSDRILDGISSKVISESLLLCIHLGIPAAFWQRMQTDRHPIVKINEQMLEKWKKEQRRHNMRDLAQALCNVGFNITTVFPDPEEIGYEET